MRKLILFLTAVSLMLSAEKALCYETTFSIEPESFNSFRYHEMHVEEAAPLSIRRGRFLSVDPTWESADLGTPQSWNRYSYVLNNPVRYTDPDGRCGTVWTCAVWGARAGSKVSVPGMVIGIVVGATVGYGITHPNEVAALGNNMGGGSAGERFAENWIRQNNANHMSEQADLPELPARDATGKVHTNDEGLPTAEDLQKYPTEDLKHFQDELKGSVGERIKTTSSLPDQPKEKRVKHGERQAEEQRLIKAIDKIIKDREGE